MARSVLDSLQAELQLLDNLETHSWKDTNGSTTYARRFKQIADKHLPRLERHNELYVAGLQLLLEYFAKKRPSMTSCDPIDDLARVLFLECARIVLSERIVCLPPGSSLRESLRCSFSYCKRQLRQKGLTHHTDILLWLLDHHWLNPVLASMITGQGVDPVRALNYLRQWESAELLLVRLQVLYESRCTDFALNLCRWCMLSPRYTDNQFIQRLYLQLLADQGHTEELRGQLKVLGCCRSHQLLQEMAHGSPAVSPHILLQLSQALLMQDMESNKRCCSKELVKFWMQQQRMVAQNDSVFIQHVTVFVSTLTNPAYVNFVAEALGQEDLPTKHNIQKCKSEEYKRGLHIWWKIFHLSSLEPLHKSLPDFPDTRRESVQFHAAFLAGAIQVEVKKQQQLNDLCASSQAHLQGLTSSLFCFCAKHCPWLLQICLVAVFSQKPTEDMYHWVSQMMDIVQKKNKIELHTLPWPTELPVLTENSPVPAQEVVPLIARGVPGSSLPSETREVLSQDCDGSKLPCAIAAECVTSTGSCSEPDCDTDTSNKCPSGVPCQAFQPCAVCPLSSSLHVVLVGVVKLCIPYDIGLNQCPDCLKKSCLSVLKKNAKDQVFENGNACVSQQATEMIHASDTRTASTNDLTAQTSSRVEIEMVSDVECAVNESKSALEPSSPNMGASQAEPEVAVQEDLKHVSFGESQVQTLTSSLESMRTSGVDLDTSMLEAEVQASIDFDIKPLARCSLTENVVNFQRASATTPSEDPKEFAVDVSQAMFLSSDAPRVSASAVEETAFVGKNSHGNRSLPCSHESKNHQLCLKLSSTADVCVNVDDSVGGCSSDQVNSKDTGLSHEVSRTTSPLAKLLMLASSSVDDLACADWEHISESSEEVILLTESSQGESISSDDDLSSDSVVLLDEEPITTTQFGLEEDKLHLYLSTTNSESQDADTELSDMEEGSLFSDDLDPFDLPDLSLPDNGPLFDHTYIEPVQVEHRKPKSVSHSYPEEHSRAQCFDNAHRTTTISVQDCINLLETEEDSDDYSNFSEVKSVDESDDSQPASAVQRSVFDFLLDLKKSSERKYNIPHSGPWLTELDGFENASTSSAVDYKKCIESANGTSRGYHLVDPSYPCVQKKEDGGMIPDEKIHIKDDKSFRLDILDTLEMAKPLPSTSGEVADLCKPSGLDVENKCVVTGAADKSCLYGYSAEASEEVVMLESSGTDGTVPYGYRDPDMQRSDLYTEVSHSSGGSFCLVTNSLPDIPWCFGDLNHEQKVSALAIKEGFLQQQYSQDISGNLMLYCTEQNIDRSSVVDNKMFHTLVNRHLDETGFGASNSEQYRCQNSNPRCMDEILEGRINYTSCPVERISNQNMNKQNVSELCHDGQRRAFDTQSSISGMMEPQVCLPEEKLVCERSPGHNVPTDNVKKEHETTSGNSLRSSSPTDTVTSEVFTSDCFELKMDKNGEDVPNLDEMYLPGELLTDPECIIDVQSMYADVFVKNTNIPPASVDLVDCSNPDVDSPSYLEFESVDDNIFLLHRYCCSDIDTGSEADDFTRTTGQILKNLTQSEEQEQTNNQTAKRDSEKQENPVKDSVSAEMIDASILSTNKECEFSDALLCGREIEVSHSLDSREASGDDFVGIAVSGPDNYIPGMKTVSSDVSCRDQDAQETAMLEDVNIWNGSLIQTKSQEEFAKIVDLYFFDGTTESDSPPCRERKILKCRLQIDMDIQFCLLLDEDTVDYIRQLSGLKKSIPAIPTSSVEKNDHDLQKISIMKQKSQSEMRLRRSPRKNRCSRQLDILGKRRFSHLVLSEFCYLKYDKIMGHWFCQLCKSYSYQRISAQKHMAHCHPRTWRQWLNSQCPVRKNLF